jgi:hypothetical protein
LLYMAACLLRFREPLLLLLLLSVSSSLSSSRARLAPFSFVACPSGLRAPNSHPDQYGF